MESRERRRGRLGKQEREKKIRVRELRKGV